MFASRSPTVVVFSFVVLLYLVTRCGLTQGHKGPPFMGPRVPAYGGLNEQNSQKTVIVYNELCAYLYHFKFKAQSFSLPTNVIVALNIRRLFLMIVSKLILFN